MTTVESPVADLFNDDINPMLRRLGARPRGAGDQPPEEADAEARVGVWATLTELGGLAPAAAANGLAARVDIAGLMGPALYQSPYLDTMIATDLLREDGAGDAVADIAAGRRTVALALRETGTDEPGAPPSLGRTAPAGTLHGVRRFVAFAADVDDLMVLGPDGYALVPARQPGVALRGHDDIGRGDLYRVTFDGAAVARYGGSAAAWARALARGRLQHAAYLAGLSREALDLTVARLRERRAFGRPLAALQAPAFRLAALAARITAVQSLVRTTAAAADQGEDIRLTAAQALFLAADLSLETTAEAVHLHGASGLAEEQDVSVFYRRAVVDSVRLGTPTRLRLEAAGMLRRPNYGLGE